jgi:8-oxo-dGTP pyrophosphatase MutT (NUDIX family)
VKKFSQWLFEAAYDNDKGGKFWGNKAGGVLAYCPKTRRFLMGLRSSEVNEPLTWGVIGGKLDNVDGSVQQTVHREFQEETGYSGKMKLYPMFVFHDNGKTFEYHNFLGILEKEFEPELDWETERTEWMTLEELLKLPRKHWGLELLLKNSMKEIEKIIDNLSENEERRGENVAADIGIIPIESTADFGDFVENVKESIEGISPREASKNPSRFNSLYAKLFDTMNFKGSFYTCPERYLLLGTERAAKRKSWKHGDPYTDETCSWKAQGKGRSELVTPNEVVCCIFNLIQKTEHRWNFEIDKLGKDFPCWLSSK